MTTLARVALPLLPLVFAVALTSDGSAKPPAKGHRLLEPFDYRGVSLNSGLLRRQFDETRDYYLRIPNDDLLKGFRRRASLPAPGVELGGWYSNDIFHVFGQIVSGLARMYVATGDPACKAKVDVLVSEWGKCIAEDGYFFYSEKPNAPHYVYDKTVCGLVDAYLYCGNEEALHHLSRITEWAEENLERANSYAHNAGQGPTEWYTLTENLYRAYLATGDSRYRDFGRVWEYTDFWDHFADRTDVFTVAPKSSRYHAYSHVNSLSGAGAAFLVTGEKRYLSALRNAYDYLQAKQVYATGGYGPDEGLLPSDELLGKLYDSVNQFEVECGSWAGFKLAKYLISFTGDAKYGDWIERLIYNGIGASLPMTPDGRPDYYSEQNVSGSAKRSFPAAWGCCAGTRPQAIADYHDLIYFRDSEGLFVNLFVGSTASWKSKGDQVIVRQITRFPEDPNTEFIISVDKPTAFALRVRVPEWLSGPMTASVNGETVPAKANALHWAKFRRTWSDGDRLVISLPMALRSSRFPLDSKQAFPAAVLHGPVILAFRSPSGNPARLIDVERLDECLQLSPGEALTYHLETDSDVLARPLYAFKENEQYYAYLDPSVAWTRHAHPDAQFSLEWGSSIEFRMSNVPGASVLFSFEGTGIRWRGYRFDDAGNAEVRVDGELIETVDQYGRGRMIPFQWERIGLTPGRHSITLSVTTDRNPNSSGTWINVSGFEVLP